MARTPSKHRKINRGIKPPGSEKAKKKTTDKKEKAAVPRSVAKLLKQEVTHRHLGKVKNILVYAPEFYSFSNSVTRAALKRAACRAGIRCIAKECLDELLKMFDATAHECLLQARNNAYYVRQAKTIASTDIVTGSREMGLGDLLVC